jgi:hypothetical protein
MLAKLGRAEDSAPVAQKQIASKLTLQFTNLFADTGLRGVENLCRARDVEAVVEDCAEVTKLLEMHCL